MTAKEFISHIANDYPLGAIPKTLGVSKDTYINLCQYLFTHLEAEYYSNFCAITLLLSPRKNLMFRNVEIIVDDKL